MLKITINQDYVGVSPNGFLKKRVDLPYFKIKKLCEKGKILVNGQKIKDDYKFNLGDTIEVNQEGVNLREIYLQKQNNQTSVKLKTRKRDLYIETIYEDENFIVLNKKANIVVQTEIDNPNSLNWHLNYLKFKNKDFSQFQYTNCHRLDKDTSGVIICAKNPQALRDMNLIFKEKKVKKLYRGLVIGNLKKKEGIVKLDLERTPEGVFPKVIPSPLNSENKTKRETISKYKFIKEYKKKEDIFSLVEIEILTGYTHQIRVHMKYLNCPIIFDRVYGNIQKNEKYAHILNRQFLHAKTVEFEYLDKKYKFIAPLTPDLENFLNFL